MILLLALGCSLLPGSSSVTPKVTPSVPLVGHVGVDDTRLTVFNDGDIEWTDVVATANGALACKLGIVHPHDQGGINFTSCTGALTGPITNVKVTATQGYLEAATAGAVDAAAVPVAGAEAHAENPSDAVRLSTGTPTSGTSGSTAAAPAPASTASGASGASESTAPAGAATPTATSAAPPANPGGALSLSAVISGGIGPARRLTVFNNGGTGWTGCKVTANELYSYALGTLPAGEHNGIMMIKFKDKSGNMFTSTAQVTKARVTCDQGTASVTPT